MTTIDTDGFLSDEADDGKQILRAKHPSVFDVAYGLNTVAVQKLGCAKLSECTDPQFVLYLLAIRVIEAFEAVVLLSERGMIASAKLVIRPQLEAVFTLAAIDRDSGLVDRYFDAHTHAQYQRLRASKDWQAPKLKTIFETDKLGAKLKEAEAARKKAPPKTLKPYEWAGLAEMSDYYNLYYVQYASYTHSNRESLEENLEWNEDGSVDAAFGPSDKDFYETVRNSAAFTLLAVMHMCHAFSIPLGDELESIKLLIDRCDAQYYSS